MFLAFGLIVSNSIATSSTAQSSGVPSVEQRARINTTEDADFVWGHQSARVGWRWGSPFGEYAGSVSVFAGYTNEGVLPGQPSRSRFVARQVERTVDAPDRVYWAESDRCPALIDRLRTLEALSAPQIKILNDELPSVLPVIVLHGTGWLIWSREALQDGRYPSYVEMSSNAGAIAEWGQASRVALTNCWSETEPAR